jgi:tRNA threonylcarbamoyladenosine biosynthesis protein TsaE
VATFTSNSPAETERIGRQLAAGLKRGDVLALKGDLGAGKTQFSKGIVAGLGSSAAATSPTFTIIHEYLDGRLPVYHFDFFRIEDERALDRLGLDEYFSGDGVCVVEWADRFPRILPRSTHWINFEMKADETRIITTQ